MSLKLECEELEKFDLSVLEDQFSQHEQALCEFDAEIKEIKEKRDIVKRDRNKFWFVIRKKKGY